MGLGLLCGHTFHQALTMSLACLNRPHFCRRIAESSRWMHGPTPNTTTHKTHAKRCSKWNLPPTNMRPTRMFEMCITVMWQQLQARRLVFTVADSWFCSCSLRRGTCGALFSWKGVDPTKISTEQICVHAVSLRPPHALHATKQSSRENETLAQS